MDLNQLITLYHGMDTAHLTIDELDHELRTRSMNDEASRSQKEQALHGRLKEGKSMLNVEFRFVSVSVDEELAVCDDKLSWIKRHLESSRSQRAPAQVYKTRLVHFLFRLIRLKERVTDEKKLTSIATLARVCMELLNTYYSLTSHLPVVRAAELALVNESLTKLLREEVVGEEGQIDKEDEKGTGDGNKVQQNATKERLLATNKELITVVHQLMNQIQMLEATQKEKDKPCKTTNSTLIAERVTKNSAEGKPNPNDFLDWLKQKGSVETSLNESEGTKSNDKPNVNGASTHGGLTVNKRLPVHKWAIHYDGMDNGRKLNEFLKEVEFNARSEHFSEDELFLSAHHLFTHKARAWFMEVNGNNELGSWRRLVEELKAEFLPVDVDYVYERQASNRKQGAREKFQDFYLDMVRIFRNMSSPWDDKRKFEVLFRNTREECQIAMLAANISDIPSFDVGQRVFKRSFRLSSAGNDYNAKLGPQYVPCVIVAKKGTSSYEVADMNGKSLGVFSAGDLKA
uniref:(northern house mosquito) hypothetical protein n=2 Tax=Culex pipiens TaxID=7175 RepID=A0A8D8D7T4_CULPI